MLTMIGNLLENAAVAVEGMPKHRRRIDLRIVGGAARGLS